jgi:hypothetical protein
MIACDVVFLDWGLLGFAVDGAEMSQTSIFVLPIALAICFAGLTEVSAQEPSTREGAPLQQQRTGGFTSDPDFQRFKELQTQIEEYNRMHPQVKRKYGEDTSSGDPKLLDAWSAVYDSLHKKYPGINDADLMREKYVEVTDASPQEPSTREGAPLQQQTTGGFTSDPDFQRFKELQTQIEEYNRTHPQVKRKYGEDTSSGDPKLLDAWSAVYDSLHKKYPGINDADLMREKYVEQ